jgi:polar amino acid transport system substrate-binding protein
MAGALTLGLVACGSDDNGGSSSSSDVTSACGEIKVDKVDGFAPIKSGTLTVVTSLPGPGFWNGDSPEKLTSGYEFCIAQAMKQAFGLDKLAVRNENFDAIVTGAVKDYDIALSQVTITDDRAKVVSFSEPYFESQQGILTNKGTTVTNVDDAKKLQWAVQTGTTGELLINQKLKPTKEAQPFQDLAAAFAALSAGQVDAVAMDTAIVLGQAANSNGAQVVSAQFAQPGGPDKYGAVFPKDSKNIAAVNSVLKNLTSNGMAAQFGTKNLSADPGNLTTIDLG